MVVVESERPGRKPKPMLALRQRDVCAIDPSRDSTTCPDASIYRYQTGCHGAACRLKQHNAYERRKNGKARPEATPVKVSPTKAAKKTNLPPDKKAPPFKKGGKPGQKAPAKKAPAKKSQAVTKTVSRRRVPRPVSKRPAA